MEKLLKAVLFDLDGTLLPMDEEKFTNGYFELLPSYLEKSDTKNKNLCRPFGLALNV